MLDLNKTEKEFLVDYNKIIKQINLYQLLDKGFCLRDLLTDEQQSDNIMIYETRGILQTLISFGYVEIFSHINGRVSGLIYRAKKKIEVKK